MQSEELLFLSPFFYPEPISTGKYNGLVAQSLARRGVQVSAICSHPVYPEWVPKRTAADLPGVLAIRGGAWIRYPGQPLIRRAILELWYAAHSTLQMLRVGRQAGRVLAVFPPSLFMLTVPFLVRGGTQITGIVHDLQGVYAARRKGGISRLVNGVIHQVEKRAFRSCNRLVFLSETMRELAIRSYDLDRARTSVQYPFATIQDADEGRDDELDPYFEASRKSLVYSGALGEKQAPEKLLAMLVSALDRHSDWQARIFSQGPIFERLRASVQHERLAFHPLVDARLLPALLRRSDVQIVPQDVGTSDGSLPSKVPNIIAAGTRLLCITDAGSELERLVEGYPAGVSCTSWERADLDAAVDRLMALPRATPQGSAALLRKFTLDGLIDRLLDTGIEA